MEEYRHLPEFESHEAAASLRVFIGESDRWNRKPLYEAIMLRARERGLAGCTVARAIAGYGANSRIRTVKVLRLSMDLPIIVEIIDSLAKIEEFLPELHEMVKDGLITVHPISIKLYRSSGQ